MGAWGPGLYANDLAKDLKSTIGSVLKLPVQPTDLIHLLQDFPAMRDGRYQAINDISLCELSPGTQTGPLMGA